MVNIYILLGCFLAFWYFSYLRKVSEAATKKVQDYCQQNDLQYIAIARRSSRVRFSKTAGVYLLSLFDFDFSGDGESSYQGVAVLQGLKITDIQLPPYRIH